MDSGISLAIIIPTWRRAAQLLTLLNSLDRQIRLPDEIIICCRYNDGESRDAIEAWAKSSPLGSRHKVAKVYEGGHLPPLVAALELCESNIFCLVDDDAIPRNDWLLRLEEDFDDPRIGGIGGKVINHVEKHKGFDFDRPEIETPGKLSWFGRSGKFGPLVEANGDLYEADCFVGCNMAFRTQALVDAVDMTLNGGSAISYETDIALSARRQGFRVFYDPQAVVDHYPLPRQIDIQRGWNAKECFWYAHNLTYICFKHLRWYGKLLFLLYFFIGGTWGCPGPMTYLLSLIRARHTSWRQQLLPALRGRLAGLTTYLLKNAHQVNDIMNSDIVNERHPSTARRKVE